MLKVEQPVAPATNGFRFRLFGDSHLGHVFNDGPRIRAACAIALTLPRFGFIPRNDMEVEGYGAYLDQVEDPR